MDEVKQTLNTISGFARETGMDRRTVTKILNPIKPDAEDAKAKYWSLRGWTEGVKRYYAPSEETTLNDERLRLTKAQADERELAVQAARGELLPVEDVSQALASVMSELKSNLINLPPKLAPAVFNATTAREVEEVAKDIIHASLFRASESLTDIIDSRKGVDASPEADDIAVGSAGEEA